MGDPAQHEASAALTELAAALEERFPEHVAARLADRGLAIDDELAAAVRAGAAWLHAALEALRATPVAEQRRGPLELFQEATRPVNEALARRGVPTPERDPAAAAALPGDTYDLAPASSQELGRQVWRAHLRWGVAKAKALGAVSYPVGVSDADAAREAIGADPGVPEPAPSEPAPSDPAPSDPAPSDPAPSDPGGPVVALVSADLMDRSRVDAAVQRQGWQMEVWRNPAAIEAGLAGRRPQMMLVDLSHAAADEAIRRGAEVGIRVVAYGPHVDDLALARATSLGAHTALPRSKFFRRLDRLLPPWV